MLATREPVRRERTFIGSVCAACEEPLEHILRGERVLRLTCGHVAHEACLYEFVKETESGECPTCSAPLTFDTSRGGNIDYDNLNKLIRAAQNSDYAKSQPTSDSVSAWTAQTVTEATEFSDPSVTAASTYQLSIGKQPSQTPLLSNQDAHSANERLKTATSSEPSSPRFQPTSSRNGDEPHSPESLNGKRRLSMKYPIAEPVIKLRSEFPSIIKSHKQQSLTCMITVEVAESKWPAHPVDFRQPAVVPATIDEELPAVQHITDSAEEFNATQPSEKDLAVLEGLRDDLFQRVENWHGLDYQRFGKLIMHGAVKVGKDRKVWQELECYLFTEMLICVKERKRATDVTQPWDETGHPAPMNKFVLKGSILIKKHLEEVEAFPEFRILALKLSVAELPAFYLLFHEREQLDTWSRALRNLNWSNVQLTSPVELEATPHVPAEEHESEQHRANTMKKLISRPPSQATISRPHHKPSQESINSRKATPQLSVPLHIPLDVVVVIPASSTVHGLKVNILRDSLRFILSLLGDRDRLAVVSYGLEGPAQIIAPLATSHHSGWAQKLASIQPIQQKAIQPNAVEGANTAMGMLMRRRSSNPLSHILLISDSVQANDETVELLISRADTSNVGIHCFGLGMTHKADDLIKIAASTRASYTYVKDWMMLRECLAGCIGSLQSISHPNSKLRLRIPDGSPAKFVKIRGALEPPKSALGREADVHLGDLRYGDKREILVQLAIQPERNSEATISDHWESMISNLQAISPIDQMSERAASILEIPVLECDLEWADVLRDGNLSQLPQPSLLAVTQLPPRPRSKDGSPPIGSPSNPTAPHPYVVQRRLELLTSDMLTRALTLVDKNQPTRANHLLAETRTILKGLSKGNLPSPPSPPPTASLPATPKSPPPSTTSPPPLTITTSLPKDITSLNGTPISSRPQSRIMDNFVPSVTIDQALMDVLDSELTSNLEWISHPDVFARDSRKAILQTIGVIESQRGYTLRTPLETFWANRIPGIKFALDRSREWRELARNSQIF